MMWGIQCDRFNVKDFSAKLASKNISVSAPCRIDLGGTLDIPTFYIPLRHHRPVTFNMALSLRTRVTLAAGSKGKIRISSRGFEDAEFVPDQVPFNHPMGLMFLVPIYFGVTGVHIQITSASPPRSALGGSSVAVVAMIHAFAQLLAIDLTPWKIALLAYQLESCIAGVPCGIQDQLAAVYGGINAWSFLADLNAIPFQKDEILSPNAYRDIENRLLVAYCGIPHASKDINGKWVRDFIAGSHRTKWHRIIAHTHEFIDALRAEDYAQAAEFLNLETDLRIAMTPDVLDEMGHGLVSAAKNEGCGARFTGAGGGGCVWALGPQKAIQNLQEKWENLLYQRNEACILNVSIDPRGVLEAE